MNHRFCAPVFLLLLILACSTSLRAQTTGTLTGEVQDESGAVISGAEVIARNTERGAARSAFTGPDGRYRLAGLPVGVYEVRAQSNGFRPMVRSGVILTVHETAAVDFILRVGQLDQAIVVLAQSSPVNVHSPELSYLVADNAIRELPLNGRNYTDLALLQPGVVSFPHRDGGSVVAHGLATSINGQDPRSNVYLIDGTPQNDFTNGPAGSAAGTALGVETIREFRVETNSYSAEYGRNSGGQINAITRSGTNEFAGNAFWYHRNDNFDARNFFDPAKKPEFVRNQMGGTVGGPIRRDGSFFFLGYESLRERLGRTIVSVVPNLAARMGMLPPPNGTVTVSPAVQPYLDEFPLPNGPDLGGGLARFTFPFRQRLDQDFGQARYDHHLGAAGSYFVRYTYDGAEQHLPTDFPQFPRSFLSRNQFVTLSYQHVQSPTLLHDLRFGFSRTRVGQDVEANTTQALMPFIVGRPSLGDIDIGGIPRFGPQSSVNVQLVQNVFGWEYGGAWSRGAHLVKFGGLAEHYQDNLFNPTFSRGIFTFPSLSAFLQSQPQRFVGLPLSGALDRYWRFTLFGFYVQDSWRVHPLLTLSSGVRYEFATMPKDIQGRDSALINLTDAAPTVGQLYQNPTYRNFMPRFGLAWDPFGKGKTSVRAGYGLFFNTNNQQNLIVTITNPPFTPRVIFGAPGPGLTFPQPDLSAGSANSIRPVQWDLDNPYVHVWNLTIQQRLWWETVVTAGYAGSRGIHLLRSGDWNIATPTIGADGRPVFPPLGTPRRNPNFSTIELKSSDGNSWYNALIVEVKRRWRGGFTLQSSYTFSRNIDTTQASTFFSDATNGTTTAFPEFPGLNYNRGLSDFHAKHNWVFNFIWEIPLGSNFGGVMKTFFRGWQLAGIANVRSGSPLTVFVQQNISRSLWSPSNGPGIGFDRPNVVSGFTSERAVTGDPSRWFDPSAFALPAAGTLGSAGRGAFIGPNLRTFDLSLAKNTPISLWGSEGNIQFRVEAFNLFNRTNFGLPSLIAFTGTGPSPTFGQMRSTVTTSRQVQLGLRWQF